MEKTRKSHLLAVNKSHSLFISIVSPHLFQLSHTCKTASLLLHAQFTIMDVEASFFVYHVMINYSFSLPFFPKVST